MDKSDDIPWKAWDVGSLDWSSMAVNGLGKLLRGARNN
jgi:hypothetical protein